MLGGGELRVGDFPGAVHATVKLLDPPCVDIEADNGEMARHINRKRKSHIAQSDYTYANVIYVYRHAIIS
jgi:hypothetical protein